MTTTAKKARAEIIELANKKGYLNITNEDIASIIKNGCTFREASAALRWLTYSKQAAKYRV